MNNDQLLAKILYKNLLGSKNFYGHSDFTTSDSIKLSSSDLDRLGLVAPIYFNPIDLRIYSGVNLNSSSMKFSESLTNQIVSQTDYLLSTPVAHFINTSKKKALNRVVLISLSPDIHRCFIDELASSNVFFFNSPSIFNQIAVLNFSRENVKHQLIESCFKKFEGLLPDAQPLSLTLLSSLQAMHSLEILKHQKLSIIFCIVGVDNWINKNFPKKDLTDDEINRLIDAYNKILENIHSLSTIKKCQIIWAESKFAIKLTESISVNINPSNVHNEKHTQLDESSANKIRKLWHEKTPKTLLDKFNL